MNRRWQRLGWVVAFAGVGLVGCGDDDDTTPAVDAGITDAGGGDAAPPIDATVTGAMVRVVHASPGAPAVDIYAGPGSTTPIISDLAYGEASNYLPVPDGTTTVLVRAAGSPASGTPAFMADLTLSDGQKVTAVAAGLLSSTAEADRFRIVPLVEGFGADAAGSARVRVVHAGADAPTVAIDVGDDGSSEVESLARFADTGAAGVALPSGAALQIGIRAGGARVTAFTTPNLPDQSELFVIATGLLSELPREEQGFGLLAVGEAGVVGLIRQNPVVYALHGSPDAPPVDVFAATSELADDLEFGELSAAIQVPPGAYTLDFFAHADGSARPAGSPAASAMTPALAAGERYLAMASGFLSPEGAEPAFRLIAAADEFALDDAANARVRVVHGSPDAPNVDVGPVASGVITPVLEDVPFAASSPGAGLMLAPGAIQIGIAEAGSTTPAAAFDLNLTAGLRAFAVAAGALTAVSGEESFRLLVVDTSVSPWTVASVDPID